MDCWEESRSLRSRGFFGNGSWRPGSLIRQPPSPKPGLLFYLPLSIQSGQASVPIHRRSLALARSGAIHPRPGHSKNARDAQRAGSKSDSACLGGWSRERAGPTPSTTFSAKGRREHRRHELVPESSDRKGSGGDAGIRTLDTLVGYAHLANECLQPLGHVSIATRIDNPGLAIKVKSQHPPSFMTDTVMDTAWRPAQQSVDAEAILR